jgi:hypothetical protein
MANRQRGFLLVRFATALLYVFKLNGTPTKAELRAMDQWCRSEDAALDGHFRCELEAEDADSHPLDMGHGGDLQKGATRLLSGSQMNVRQLFQRPIRDPQQRITGPRERPWA